MTATVPTTDVLAALVRADARYCKRQRYDEPTPRAHLQALADALPTSTPEPVEIRVPDPAVVADLEQARAELAGLRRAHEELATIHGGCGRQHTGTVQRLDQMESTVAEQATALETTQHALGAAQRGERSARGRADFARIDRAAALGHLRTLLEAILGEPVDGRASVDYLDAAIARSGDLVAAAVDQIELRFADGQHVHQYPIGDDDAPGPCACSKPFPRPTKGRR